MASAMRLHLGTSGFSYPAWKGAFYPEDLPQSRMLGFYAGRFGAVEINSSFYRTPLASALAAWHEATPESFRFAIKCPQRVSHIKQLVGTDEDLRQLVAVLTPLHAKLGPLLVQLPPTLRIDLPRLDHFLAQAPRGLRLVIELRHGSWFLDETYALLRRHHAALCIADSEDLTTPLVPTAAWGYLRLRRDHYAPAMLAHWAERVRAQAWSEAWVFFKHEDTARGPAYAERFIELW